MRGIRREGTERCIRFLSINAKKYLHDGVIVKMALYEAETSGMSSAERRRVNVLEVKCLRSMTGATRIDRGINKEVCKRPGIERMLAGRVDQ